MEVTGEKTLAWAGFLKFVMSASEGRKTRGKILHICMKIKENKINRASWEIDSIRGGDVFYYTGCGQCECG